jgi:hypothetical protein
MTVHGIGAMAGPDAEQAIEDLYRTHGLGLVRFALLLVGDQHTADGEDRRAVLAAVASLPRRQREVLALKFYLGLGEQEVAAALRISGSERSGKRSERHTRPALTTGRLASGFTPTRPRRGRGCARCTPGKASPPRP